MDLLTDPAQSSLTDTISHPITQRLTKTLTVPLTQQSLFLITHRFRTSINRGLIVIDERVKGGLRVKKRHSLPAYRTHSIRGVYIGYQPQPKMR